MLWQDNADRRIRANGVIASNSNPENSPIFGRKSLERSNGQINSLSQNSGNISSSPVASPRRSRLQQNTTSSGGGRRLLQYGGNNNSLSFSSTPTHSPKLPPKQSRLNRQCSATCDETNASPKHIHKSQRSHSLRLPHSAPILYNNNNNNNSYSQNNHNQKTTSVHQSRASPISSSGSSHSSPAPIPPPSPPQVGFSLIKKKIILENIFYIICYLWFINYL